MVKKTFNAPVSIQIYLGSGKTGERLRNNLLEAAGKDSVSEFVVRLIKKADSTLFKGIDDGKK